MTSPSQSGVHLFERPLPAGWVYPCTVEDLAERLAQLPAEDLQGLWAVGLVPATRRDHWADARYFRGEKPAIHVYSREATGSEGLRPIGGRRGA